MAGGEAIWCPRCRTSWHGQPGDVCKVCLEAKLAEEHGIYPGKGWKGPI